MGGMQRDDPKFRIDPAAFKRGASALGCEPEALQAVVAVGFLDTGFDPDGIAPRVRFDARWFSRLTDGKFDATHPDLSNPDYFPDDDAPLPEEHQRLRLAMAVERNAAISSAAWGRFQIMGAHWKLAGCPSLQHFVNAMYSDETAQFNCFVQLAQRLEFGPYLAEHRWADFKRDWDAENSGLVKPATYRFFAADVRTGFAGLKGVTA